MAPGWNGWQAERADTVSGRIAGLSRSELTGQPDRSVGYARYWRSSIGQHLHIDIDEAMAFMLVISGDAGAHG